MTYRILLFAAAALTAGCGTRPEPVPERPQERVSDLAVAAAAPVTGTVVRGVNAAPPVGKSGSAAGRTCDFSREEVVNGAMTGASVQCGAGATLPQLLASLPATFNSYCVADAGRLGGRLIVAPIPGNAQHCDLSGIKPNDAQTKFGGAKWR